MLLTVGVLAAIGGGVLNTASGYMSIVGGGIHRTAEDTHGWAAGE